MEKTTVSILKFAALRHAVKTDDLSEIKRLLADSGVRKLICYPLPGESCTTFEMSAHRCQRDVVEQLARLSLIGADGNGQDKLDSALRNAARYGRLATVNLLLDLWANPCAVDDRGFTAAHEAAVSGRVQAVEALLDRVSDLSFCDLSAGSPLAYALLFGRHKCADVLVKHGAPTDIFAAVVKKDSQTIKSLLKTAPAAALARMHGFEWGIYTGPTPLILAVLLGEPGAVEVLAARLPNGDKTENGFSALSIAAEMARFPPSSEPARPGYLPSYGSPAERMRIFQRLAYVATKPDLTTLVALGDREGLIHALSEKPNAPNGTTDYAAALKLAVHLDATEMAADIIAASDPVSRPLGAANLSMKNKRITQMLLEAGASPNDANAMLGGVMFSGNTHELRLLLKAGADPNMPVGKGYLLHIACEMTPHIPCDMSGEETVSVLIKAGADPDRRDCTSYGFAPLHRLALMSRFRSKSPRIPATADVLRSAGADFSLRDTLLGATAHDWLYYAFYPKNPPTELLAAFAP